ncbi:MAG: CIA30 family protein [Pseudomonadota bacterium]
MLTSYMLSIVMMSPLTTMDSYLERAIARGVPLYNNGQPAACAAVYATALEAVAETEGWPVEATRRRNLKFQLELAEAVADPDEQAWAYRRIIDALLADAPLAAPPEATVRELYTFADANEVEAFRVVLDGVMGGLSTGQLSRGDNSLIFTGDTSLQNNGGFSSIRAPLAAGSLAGFDALRIRIKGDGRRWILGARSSAGNRGDSYWARFETTADEWQTVTVPIGEMTRTFFGQPRPGRLRPAGVRGLEFYIYDKKAGPFRLEVDRIEAVRLPESV